jgi:predicted TIM-barrel fold metal-dependent hydrolase
MAEMSLQSEMALLAKINGFRLEELDYYDQYKPVNLKHYVTVEKSWLKREMRYLQQRICRIPTTKDKVQYILEQHASKKFRAYYALRFPENVNFVDKESEALMAIAS